MDDPKFGFVITVVPNFENNELWYKYYLWKNVFSKKLILWRKKYLKYIQKLFPIIIKHSNSNFFRWLMF